MKKSVLMLCLFMIVATLLGASAVESLYTLVVPSFNTSLSIGGGVLGAGPDALRLKIDWSPPGTVDFDVGVTARYNLEIDKMYSSLAISADASVLAGTSALALVGSGSGYYKQYNIELGGLKGFYGAGGDLEFGVGGFSWLELEPYGEFGLGRIYQITILKEIELMAKHLGVDLTEQMASEVASIIYLQRSRLGKYSENEMENYRAFYNDIAAALGVPEQVLDVTLLARSQEYVFEQARYRNLRYGWEAKGRFTLVLDTTTTPVTFGGAISFHGDYGTFLIPNQLYLGASGKIGIDLKTARAKIFNAFVTADANLRYLPDDYRWWIDSSVGLELDLLKTPIFSFALDGIFNYLITPNFTVFGGLQLRTGTSVFQVSAGGEYRLF